VVDLHEQVLDPDPRDVGLDDATELGDGARLFVALVAAVHEVTIDQRNKRVLLEAVRELGDDLVELGAEAIERGGRFDGQRQLDVRRVALTLPAFGAVHEVPERDVMPALLQVEVAGAQRVARRECERELPYSPVAAPLQRRSLHPGGELDRRVFG
jgi:hypothetical protein